MKQLSVSDINILAEIKNEFEDAYNLNQLQSAFNSGNFYAIGKFEGEDLVGVITYSVATPCADIETLFVKEQYRKRGIAKGLVLRACELLKELGVEKVFIEVRKSNISAISLYKKCGFNEISCRKKYYSDGEDALVLIKE